MYKLPQFPFKISFRVLPFFLPASISFTSLRPLSILFIKRFSCIVSSDKSSTNSFLDLGGNVLNTSNNADAVVIFVSFKCTTNVRKKVIFWSYTLSKYNAENAHKTNPQNQNNKCQKIPLFSPKFPSKIHKR
jgi:hypothetical protein